MVWGILKTKNKKCLLIPSLEADSFDFCFGLVNASSIPMYFIILTGVRVSKTCSCLDDIHDNNFVF